MMSLIAPICWPMAPGSAEAPLDLHHVEHRLVGRISSDDEALVAVVEGDVVVGLDEILYRHCVAAGGEVEGIVHSAIELYRGAEARARLDVETVAANCETEVADISSLIEIE
jgi:hypothetical protein